MSATVFFSFKVTVQPQKDDLGINYFWAETQTWKTSLNIRCIVPSDKPDDLQQFQEGLQFVGSGEIVMETLDVDANGFKNKGNPRIREDNGEYFAALDVVLDLRNTRQLDMIGGDILQVWTSGNVVTKKEKIITGYTKTKAEYYFIFTLVSNRTIKNPKAVAGDPKTAYIQTPAWIKVFVNGGKEDPTTRSSAGTRFMERHPEFGTGWFASISCAGIMHKESFLDLWEPGDGTYKSSLTLSCYPNNIAVVERKPKQGDGADDGGGGSYTPPSSAEDIPF